MKCDGGSFYGYYVTKDGRYFSVGSLEPIFNFSETSEHPQLKARKITVNVPRKNGTNQRQIASPFKLMAHKIEYKFVGGRRGKNTLEVLEENGIDRDKINDLIYNNVFGTIEE